MKTKHTPGSWWVADREELETAERGQDPFGIWDDEDGAVRIASICTEAPGEEIRANAHLISACPEMFHALTEVMKAPIWNDPKLIGVHNAVKAALTKAKGES